MNPKRTSQKHLKQYCAEYGIIVQDIPSTSSTEFNLNLSNQSTTLSSDLPDSNDFEYMDIDQFELNYGAFYDHFSERNQKLNELEDLNFINNDSFIFDQIDDNSVEELDKGFESNFSSFIKEEEFLEGFTRLIIKSNPSTTFVNDLLKILNKTICPTAPLSYETLFKKFSTKLNNYNYYTRCTGCSKLIKIERSKILKERDFGCDCGVKMSWNDHKKSQICTVAFSIKEQLNLLSEHLEIDERPSNLNDPFTVNLIATLDGIPLSKSSSIELLPLVCYIENIKENRKLMNSLPVFKTFSLINDANKDSNATDQPKDYQLLIKPLIEEVNELKDGFVTKWSNKTKIVIKMFIADAPCRHDVVNFLRFNGTYPCIRCYIVFKKDNVTGEKKFPIPLSTELANKHRTLRDVEQSIEILTRDKLPHWFGVKGKSLLSELPNFNIINSTIVDVMHCVFLGVCKLLIVAYLENRGQIYFLEQDKIKIINERLSYLKPPSTFNRKLRSILEYKNYKSSEFQNHLFYCSYFIYGGNVLPVEYLNHHLLLSSAIFKLWSKYSSNEQIDQAKEQIDLFLEGIVKLNYDNSFYKYNCHVLVHLYEDRIRFGPLSLINQYSLEGLLQVLKGFLISKNKRIETIAKKAMLQSYFNLKSIDNDKEVILKGELPKDCLDNIDFDFLSASYSSIFKNLIFYEKCELKSLDLKSNYSYKKEDAYVNVENNYYLIHLFFEVSGVKKVLAKPIIIKGVLERTLSYKPNYKFTVDQYKIVDKNSFREGNNNLVIFNCNQIKKKVFYAEIPSMPDTFIVDIEN